MQLPRESEQPERAPEPFGALAPPPAPLGRVQALVLQGEKAQARIALLLARARGRAVRLALAQIAAYGLVFLGLGTALSALVGAASSVRSARLAWAALTLLGLVASWVLARRSALVRAALLAKDPRRLAQLLSAPASPPATALAGRDLGAQEERSLLLSSVELTWEEKEGKAAGASRELLALVHQRAAEQAGRLDLATALPARALQRPLLALFGGLLAVAVLYQASPRRLSLGLLRLLGGEEAAPAAERDPIAGDLSLTYLYPGYTGLPPRVEEGTAGDLHGPKGTEVRLTARADRDLAQAFAVVNGAAVQLEATGPGHRLLAGNLVLSAPGKWHLRYADEKGRTAAEGPDRPVEISADAAPQAAIEEPSKAEIEVDPQGRIAVSWSAQDDYGLSAVALVVQRSGEKEERIPLQPRGADGLQPKRLRGTYGWELSPLRLRAGDKVSFFVEAKDNDAVDGPQRGVSSTHVLKVFSAAEHHREALLRAQQLWERLVAITADRLEEKPAPATPELAAPWYAQTSQKDKEAMGLVADLGRAGRELLKDKLAPHAVARALRYAQSGLSPLVQRTSIARAPLSRGAGIREGAARLFGLALQSEIREEEKDILYLEDLLDRARLDDMQELAKELAASRRELGRLAEQLRRAPDENAKRELLAEVSRLRERVQDLMQRMAEMAKGIRDEHLNQEAVRTAEKEQDLLAQLSEIQRKLQGGDVDEALKQLDKLSAQLQQLEEGLQKKANARGEQKYSEEAKELREAARDLGKLKEREEQLEKRTGQLRREAGAQAQKRFEQRGGKDLAKRLQEKVEEARRAVAQIDPKAVEQLGMDEQLESAGSRVEDLKRALQAGDYEEALEQAQRGLRAVEMLQQRLAIEDQFRNTRLVADPAGVHKALEQTAKAQPPLHEVLGALQDALPREGEGMTPEQQQELQGQRQEQGKVREGLQGVRDRLSAVGKKVPIFGPQHEQLLQQAQDAMGQAEERLGRGQPRGAQAGETQAMEKLGQFEQAMKDLAKNQPGQGEGGMPMPWGEPQGDPGDEGDGEDSEGIKKERVEIPDAESGRGPQEFRKKLLDAMKQQAPDKYKERVKQYYEELVK